MKKVVLVVMVAFTLGAAAQAQNYTYSTLARLSLSDGKPDTSTGFLTIDPAGNIYGMANSGADPSCPPICEGYVFKVTAKGFLSKLYTFGTAKTDGTGPEGALIRDSAGNLYGEPKPQEPIATALSSR